ncbi:MAG: FAD-binding oxidoreductase [Parvularculaceae bacterium]
MTEASSHAASYYAASANPAPARDRLSGTIETDVAIIGGGFTGVTAALSLAERGRSVALIEANRIGWGASGRNGGQVLAGWSGEGEFAKQLGPRGEEFLWRTRYIGHDIIARRIERYQIQCDYARGTATVALTPKQMAGFEKEYETLQRTGSRIH